MAGVVGTVDHQKGSTAGSLNPGSLSPKLCCDDAYFLAKSFQLFRKSRVIDRKTSENVSGASKAFRELR